MSNQKKFSAMIQDAGGGGAFITIPFNVEKAYGKKRVPVKATFDGEEYRGSLVRMGMPDHILIVRKDIREKIGKSIGETVLVTLEEDTAPRTVTVPKDFSKAMKKYPEIHALFKDLSYTHQKEYINWIEEAKKAKTRQERIEKAIEMIKAGKKTR